MLKYDEKYEFFEFRPEEILSIDTLDSGDFLLKLIETAKPLIESRKLNFEDPIRDFSFRKLSSQFSFIIMGIMSLVSSDYEDAEIDKYSITVNDYSEVEKIISDFMVPTKNSSDSFNLYDIETSYWEKNQEKIIKEVWNGKTEKEIVGLFLEGFEADSSDNDDTVDHNDEKLVSHSGLNDSNPKSDEKNGEDKPLNDIDSSEPKTPSNAEDDEKTTNDLPAETGSSDTVNIGDVRDSEEETEEKSVWKRWWMIILYVLVGILVLLLILGFIVACKREKNNEEGRLIST